MNAAALNNLWNYISGLSLTAANKDWLSEKLIESKSSTETKKKGKLSEEELEQIEGAWAGEDFPTAEEIYAMRRTNHKYESL